MTNKEHYQIWWLYKNKILSEAGNDTLPNPETKTAIILDCGVVTDTITETTIEDVLND